MSGAPVEEGAPTAVNYLTIPTLPHEELREIAHVIRDYQRRIDAAQAVIDQQRLLLQTVLLAHGAPKTLLIPGYLTVTQREGKKASEGKFQEDVAVRLLSERLKADPELVRKVLKESRGAPGKPGEPGITVTVVKEEAHV